MTEKPDTTKPFLLRRENRYLWFALILPAYLLVFAWVEAVIPVEACRPTYIPLDDRIPFLEGFIVPYMLWFPMLLALGLDLHQKLLLAREVNGSPDVIVAAYPVHGVDIGATNAIHEILLRERKRGAAILMISEDLEELFTMSDRIAVLFEGKITGIVDVPEQVTQASYDHIGHLMVGNVEAASGVNGGAEQ